MNIRNAGTKKGPALTLPSVLVFAFLCLGLIILIPAVQSQGVQPAGGGSANPVEIVIDETLAPPSAFGWTTLKGVLENRGLTLRQRTSLDDVRSSPCLLIGTLSGSGLVKDLVKDGSLSLQDKKESLAVKRLTRDGKTCLVISGADERGLMYALLEAAAQVESSPGNTPVLEAVREISEGPLASVRSMAVFLHNQDDERDWYYSQNYWKAYLGMLAENRFNTLNLVFSHQTPYLAPMYPFHVSVDKYPEVKVLDLTEAERQKNMDMLKFITTLARDRGLDFTLGIWQQIAWSTATHSRAQETMVRGYDRDNMTDYTYLALKEILKECPGITGLQLRLNYESGLSYDEQTDFFRDAVFRAAKESGRPVLIEVRDIGLLSETLDAALATDLPVRVSHKYWAEHMVFPYHPAKFIWTYSYGDWLEYPRTADQIYQVWSLGSHRLLLWGDPEYVRRFAPTTTFEDAVGYEICAPLSQKGFGNAPGAWRIFRDKEREYYEWEFQRYWSYYELFGRLTYNPDTGNDIWTRELIRRFGDAADAVGGAYISASRVVPLITGQAISNYNMGSWPEKDMGGPINFYLHLVPYDKARFRGFLEYVDDVLAGRSSGRENPEEVASRLDGLADEIESHLDTAAAEIGAGNKEFWATEMDFRILAGMARYFSQKMRAATRLGFFYRTGDVSQLRRAIRHAEAGLEFWKNLSARADNIYSSNLVFGPGSVGHWKDNIRFVQDDLNQLKYQEKLFKTVQDADYAFDFGPEPGTATTSAWSATYTNDYTVERRFRGIFPGSRYDPALGFGWISSEELTADTPERVSGGIWSGTDTTGTPVPGDALLGDYIRGRGEAVFRTDLPDGHYQVAVILTEHDPEAAAHGPMNVTVLERFGDRPIVEHETIGPGRTILKTFNINMTGERFTTFRIKFHADQGNEFIVNALLFTRVEPHIAHVPVRTAMPDRDLEFTATVTLPPPPNDEHPLTSLGKITSNASTLKMPDGVNRVTLHYAAAGDASFRSLEMNQSDTSVYRTVLPASAVKAGILRYYLEAVDSTGRMIRFPKESGTEISFRIRITDDRSAPTVEHTAAAEHVPGRPLDIKVRVRDDSAVDRVILYYRPTRQTMEYSALTMDGIGGKEYTATIPGSAFTSDFDLMYYFEVFDEHGNACIYPDPQKTQPYLVVRMKR